MKKNNKKGFQISNIFNNKRKEKEFSIVVTDKINRINECYNNLKNNFLFLSESGKGMVIQVASSVASEGKSTLVSNLGVSLSFNKKKVLIIDLDFRKPRIHRIFNINNENGLVDYISDKIDITKLVKKTEYENVSVITRGSDIYNPSLLFTSEKFKALINSLKDEFDYVLFDAPPILQVSDYIHISKVSDGVLFVTAYGQTKKSLVREASNLLRKDKIKVFGAVLTFVDRTDSFANYYGIYRESETLEK